MSSGRTRVRVPPWSLKPWFHWGISSAGRAPALQAGGQGFDSPILHSLNMSGGVAERYCSSLLASRRFTRGWGFESLRLRIGQQPHPWQLWCNGNTVDRGSAIDGSIPSSCPKALVAQWIAHRFPEQGVAGSSPAKGARAMPQTPVAQRIECQLTKLKVGVRFSPGVLRARQPA